MSTSTQSIKVWDPIVRIGHWTLVIAFFTTYFTEEDFMTQHVWAGYVVAGVVLFRVFWGIVGSQHARFKDFIYQPSAIFEYLKGLAQRKPQHFLGHNPAGGVMVIALLISLCIAVYSGFALYAVENNAGPFASIYGESVNKNSVSSKADFTLIPNAMAEENEADEKGENEASEKAMASEKDGFGGTGKSAEAPEGNEGNEQDEEFWEGLHEFFANFTLFLVALHVGGVILSSYVDKENLIKAMLTGRKERH